MDSECQGKILLVGDGDFSFTLSLLKNSSLQPSQIITSNIETEVTIQQHQLAAGNMNEILHMGGLVFLEADARELHIHPTISKYRYQRIIFNFPLSDRHNIKKNRSLLADFFASCTGILDEDGQVMVTLCKGQGGTPADNPVRSWHDSWQIVAMATNSGFGLTDVVEFNASKYPEYHSVGFRFQDKSFNTRGGLTHVFERVSLVNVEEMPARSCLQYKNAEYSCSSYITNLRKRNLLVEANNPVSCVSTIMEHVISQNVEVVMQDVNDDFLLIKGHKSGVVIKSHHLDEALSGYAMGCSGDDGLSSKGSYKGMIQDGVTIELDSHCSVSANQKTSKDMKDELNIKKQNKEETLAHGVSFDKSRQSKKSISKQITTQLVMSELSLIFPSEAEAVYSAVKYPKSTQNHQTEDSEGQMVDDNYTACSQEDPSQRVFHLRTSLLEILADPGSSPSSDQNEGDCDRYKINIEGNSNSGKQCTVLTGQCYQPCDIRPDCLPVKHQMMILCKSSTPSTNVSDSKMPSAHQMSDNTETNGRFMVHENESLTRSDPLELEDKDSESVLTKIISELNDSRLFSTCWLDIKPEHNCSLDILGLKKVTNLKTIHLRTCSEEEAHEVSQTYVGVIFQIDIDGSKYDVCLLTIDNIASKVCKLPDARLLWSKSHKFLRQFEFTDFPHIFKPINLHPLKFIHDLSFWLNDAEESVDMCELLDVVRCVAGDLVIRVELVDSYKEETSGRQSHCYRLHFLSHDQALPYLTSWKLQSMIRMEVARRLAVTLR